MTKTEWTNSFNELKTLHNKKGKIDIETAKSFKQILATAKASNLVSFNEEIEVSKILDTAFHKEEKSIIGGGPNSGNRIRFNGRGPRNFGTGEKATNKKAVISRLLSYFKSEIGLILILMVTILVVVIVQVINPKLQSEAIDLIASGSYQAIDTILIWMIVLFVILSIFNLIYSLLSALLSQRIVKKMRNDLFQKIIKLPISYFDRNSNGDIMSRMTNDVDNISNTLASSLSSIFSGVLTIVGTALMMFITCFQLALISLIIVVLTVLATTFLTKTMRKFFTKRQILLGKLNGEVEEMVIGNKTVSAFQYEKYAIEEFNNISNDLTKTGIIAESLGGSMGPIMNCINNIGFVIIAAFGGYFALTGMITVGVISAFIVYVKQFSRPINELAQLYGQLQTSLASAERVFAVLDEKPEENSGTKIIDDTSGEVDFENVSFSYIPKIKVLDNINLKVKKGEKVALVGATGSGKTTVVNLLMRFYPIDSGNITIDGISVYDTDLRNLRDNCGIVLQDSVLFKGTIRENLKYADSNITDEEMLKASKECHCDSFICQMKDGYDTMLTEGGGNLSSGQRQLLTIARAFLSKPKILILDEATSSVDTRTEKQIQDAMLKLMNDRTALIIAHRLSTIQDADRIVVLDHGKIIEEGNHKELLALKGQYYSLYMTQFAGEEI